MLLLVTFEPLSGGEGKSLFVGTLVSQISGRLISLPLQVLTRAGGAAPVKPALVIIFLEDARESQKLLPVLVLFFWHFFAFQYWDWSFFSLRINFFQNCLQWGRSNLVDPAEWPKICLLNRDFGNILSIFPGKNSKIQSSLNFL